MKYAYLDGDNIGNSLRNLLDHGKEREAIHLSRRIKLAIFQIEVFAKSLDDVEIVFAGGDDVLLRFNYDKYGYVFLEDVAKIFTRITGLSMSCGIGNDANQARGSLINAKKTRNGTIRIFNPEVDTSNLAMEPTRLYVFVTALPPDSYINVIAHCNAYYKNLQKVTLVGIIRDRGKIASHKSYLGVIKNNINEQLDSLSCGKYSEFYSQIVDQEASRRSETTKCEEIEISEHISPSECKRYESIKDVDIHTEVVVYESLSSFISACIHSEQSAVTLFDVTSVSKDYLVDVFSLIRLQKATSIHSFILTNGPNFKDKYKNLIHRLTYGTTYKWPCLAKSQHTEDIFFDRDEAALLEDDVKNLRMDLKSQSKYCNELENLIANKFASFWSALYFLILLSLYIWAVKVTFWSSKGWEEVEPLTVVIPNAFLLLNYLLQLFFSKEEFSLSPLSLKSVLLTWRKKDLENLRIKRMS